MQETGGHDRQTVPPVGRLNYFINRAGRGLSKTRRAELERAKRLLSERIRRDRQKKERSA